MRTVFMGSPVYAVPVLEALISLKCEIVGVYTQPDKPRGRGQSPEPTPVKEFAQDRGLQVFQPASLRLPEVQRDLAGLEPALVVVAAYGKILPAEVLSIPTWRCVNVHPSLLPQYRGPSPVAASILEGQERTGTTIMLMDEGLDTGPILASAPVNIEAGATTESLTPHLFTLGGDLLRDVLPDWLEGKLSPQSQDDSRATVTRLLQKGDGEARWELSAVELDRRLRAFTPWPGLSTHWKGKALKVLTASPLPNANPGAAERGRVVEMEEPGIPVGVVTGSGVLGLGNLQLEGRRAVTAEEFLRGYQDFLGAQLPS